MPGPARRSGRRCSSWWEAAWRRPAARPTRRARGCAAPPLPRSRPAASSARDLPRARRAPLPLPRPRARRWGPSDVMATPTPASMASAAGASRSGQPVTRPTRHSNRLLAARAVRKKPTNQVVDSCTSPTVTESFGLMSRAAARAAARLASATSRDSLANGWASRVRSIPATQTTRKAISVMACRAGSGASASASWVRASPHLRRGRRGRTPARARRGSTNGLRRGRPPGEPVVRLDGVRGHRPGPTLRLDRSDRLRNRRGPPTR